MDEASRIKRVQLCFAPDSMAYARRLIALAESSGPDDEQLLAGCAVLFLQTTMEIVLDNLAWHHLKDEEYGNFRRRSLRDRMRLIDKMSPEPFLSQRRNAQDAYELDRLVTLRSRIAHGKDANLRIEVREIGGRDVFVDHDTGKEVPDIPAARWLRQRVWFTRLSLVDAKEIERAVTNFLTSLSPGALG